MEQTIKQTNTLGHTTILLLTIVLFYIGTLNAIGSSRIGILCLGLGVLLCGLNFIFTIFKGFEIKAAYIIILAFAFLYVITAIYSGREGNFIKELINPIQFLICIAVACSFSVINLTTSRINGMFYATMIFVLFHFAIWLKSGLTSQFASIYPNSNLVGPYMFISIFFILLKMTSTKHKILAFVTLIIAFLVLLASDTRSVLLAMFAGLLVYIFWRSISKSLVTGSVFFGIFISFIFAVIFLYPNLPNWRFYSIAENWMRANTGKSLMSGRGEIWSSLNGYLSLKPFFGYGPSTVASDLIGRQASSHNLYLNIALQVGLVGLFLFIILLYILFVMMLKRKQSRTVRLAASFYIAILTHQIFEITLIQNQLSIGVFQWAIIGIGLMPFLSKNYVDDFDYKLIKFKFK